MATGQYTHVAKNAGVIVTAPLYNQAHQNQLDNDIPTSAGAHADDLTEFRATTDPAPSGTAAPVADLGTELEQLRFVIADVKAALNGGTPVAQWYTPVTPTATQVKAHGARVYRNTTQSLSTKTPTPLIFNTVRYDTGVVDPSYDPFWSASTPTRLTASVAGLYQIIAFAEWNSGASSGLLALFIRVNGTKLIAATEYTIDLSTLRWQQVGCQFVLAQGDYVELLGFQTAGNPFNVINPEFGLELLNASAVTAPVTILTVDYEDPSLNAAFPFSSPAFVASGSVWVADLGNSQIVKFTTEGDYTGVSWGSSGSGDGQFNAPEGIVLKGGTQVYVSDGNNHRVQYFSATGTFLGKWGSSGTGDGQFNGPRGLAVDPSGNIYVCDSVNNRIQKFTQTGTFIAKWGTSGSGNGQFASPNGIFYCDATNEVYVTDSNNHRVQVFSPTGTFIRKWGSFGTSTGQFKTPKGIVVSADGSTVYVADFNNSRVQVFQSDGTYVSNFSIPFTGKPQGMAIDTDGNLYTVQGSGVFKTDTSGTLLKTIPYPTGVITSSPSGLTFPTSHIAAFAPGATVILTAVPNAHFTFSTWSGDVPAGHETDNPLTITMDSAKALKVTFVG